MGTSFDSFSKCDFCHLAHLISSAPFVSFLILSSKCFLAFFVVHLLDFFCVFFATFALCFVGQSVALSVAPFGNLFVYPFAVLSFTSVDGRLVPEIHKCTYRGYLGL